METRGMFLLSLMLGISHSKSINSTLTSSTSACGKEYFYSSLNSERWTFENILLTLIRMFLFTQFRIMHQQYFLIHAVTFSIFKHIVRWTSKRMHHCIPSGGRPGVMLFSFSFYCSIMRYLQSRSVTKHYSPNTPKESCATFQVLLCDYTQTASTSVIRFIKHLFRFIRFHMFDYT